MPLANRSIQPVMLGRKPLTEEEKEEGVAQVAVCHSAVLGALIQLASLVRHADDLFCDLADECLEIYEKTESIKSRVQNVTDIVQSMDSTTVKIPVGTLKEFCQVPEHHVAKHGYDSDLFTQANRPYCISTRYAMCEVTPVHALRGVDLYRKDGLTTSLLFKLWPIALKDAEVKTDNMNMPPKGTAHWHSWKKRYKPLRLKQRPKTIHSIEEISLEEISPELKEQKASTLSKSQPSVLVSVDTSGAGFERMSSFRQSLKEEALRAGRSGKKRRRTVTGVPNNIMQEIELFENGRLINRNVPRKYSLDDLDQADLEAKDQVMKQYLMEIDAQRAEREELQYAERERKLLKFIPCRRSRSVPRCIQMIPSMSRKHASRTPSSDKKSQRLQAEDEMSVLRLENKGSGIMHRFASSVSLGSQGSERPSRSSSKRSSLTGGQGAERLSRSSSKRSSLIGSKIKSLVSGAVRPRPRSLDFDSVGGIEDEESVKNRTTTRSASMSRMNTATLPEGTNSAAITRSASSESSVGPGSYYYFDSNTIPRAQKKYNFPWDSLPKDWTTSVKLREISKRRKEDRQSSSGNWSQSGYSSNRQSMDSDARPSMPSATSQHSLGKDSGRDSPLAEKDGLDTGYMGDAASMESVSDTKSMSNTDSDDWIRSLAERAASRGDVSVTDASALENLSRLTKENIRNLDIIVPGKMRSRQPRNDLEEDGESSVYSLDQEGFYTSFHNDSGLRRSSNTLLEEDEDMMMPRMRETKSLQSIASHSKYDGELNQPSLSLGRLPHIPNFPLVDNGNIFDSVDTSTSDTLGEDNSIEYGETGTLKAKKNKKKQPPPAPPPRGSSCLKESRQKPSSKESNKSKKDSSTSPETSSESSDQEVVYARLKLKTSISAQTFPSWCAATTSDEDEGLLNASHERLNAESSEIAEMFPCNLDGWLTETMPRVKGPTAHKSVTEEKEFPANSWPRFKKPTTFQQGILKTPEKDKIKPGQPKTLNFAPVVNLFDARTPGGREMPLSRLSSSDESNSPPALRNLEMPGPPTSSEMNDIRCYNMTTAPSMKSDTRQDDSVKQHEHCDGQTQPQPPLHIGTNRAQAPTGCPSPSPSQMSQDSFFGIPSLPSKTLDKSEITLGSNSTIALSDIDSSSLTRVSLDDSTPSGSTLSLNWDTDNTPNPTPLATPAQTHKVIAHLPTNNLSPLSAETKFDSPINKSTPNSTPYKPNVTLTKHQLPPPPPPPLLADLPSPLLDTSASPTLPPHPQLHEGINSVSNKSTSSSQKPSISIHNSVQNNNNIPVSSKGSCARAIRAYGYSNSSESSSDTNDHLQGTRTKGKSLPYFAFPENSGIDHVERPSVNQSSIVEYPTKRTTSSTANSFQYNQSWSVAPIKTDPKQQGALQSKVQRSEKRRSSPAPAVDPYWDSQGNGQRRKSGSSLASPADSGFGSPSALNESNGVNSYVPGMHSKTHDLVTPSVKQRQELAEKEHVPIVLRAPKTPQIKQAMLPDSSSSSTVPKPNINNSKDGRMQALNSGSSSQSNESLNSHLSVSSGSRLISKAKSNIDGDCPELLRGNSVESLSSNSSAGRSDSYRIALTSDGVENVSLIPNKEKPRHGQKYSSANEQKMRKGRSFSSSTESTSITKKDRPLLSKSLSSPSPQVNEDAINRADSYRCAMQNAQANILGNWAARNSSYRLATNEEDIVISDHRMDSCNLWTGKTGGTRDFRRMGITDVDQLKNYDDKGKKGAETIHSKKKLGVNADHSNPVMKESPVELRRTSKGHKDKSKQKPQPSSYIRFDPIFESGEDLRASSESLRPPSITSIQTLIKSDSNDMFLSNNPLLGRKMNARSPAQRRSVSSERKGSHERGGFLGSIKTTIKSIGGSKTDS